jgi:YesN/AraC family two-component response regulator
MKPRILFVDDDPLVLQSIERALHPLWHEWEIRCVQSGEAALERLAQEPFDVVVSDIQMPEMNGSQLLARVQKHYPKISRIILSGYCDQETSQQAITLAHEYLAKPCDTHILKSAILHALHSTKAE